MSFSLFWQVVRLSLTAGWMILVLLALRPLLKKAPRRFSCLLWGLVAIRLALPFSFESRVSMVPQAAAAPQKIAQTLKPGQMNWVSPAALAANSLPAAEAAAPAFSPASLIPLVWGLGIAAMLLYAAVSYFRLSRQVRLSAPAGKRVYRCDTISTPFILGIVNPKIYLPSDLDERTAVSVLAHEQAHLRRGDHLWKPLGYVLLSIYWFNPLCWVAYFLFCRDVEQACDEAVIEHMDTQQKKDYSAALLACATPNRVQVCPLAFAEVGVKQRIAGVLNYRKPKFWVVALAALLCVSLTAGLLTDPVKAAKTEGNTQPTLPTGEEISTTVGVPLNVRSEPTLSSPVIAMLETGTQIQILRTQSVDGIIWAYISADTLTENGWVVAVYLNTAEGETLPTVSADVTHGSPSPASDVTVTTKGTVDLYASPSVKSRVVFRLEDGSPVTILRIDSIGQLSWAYVQSVDLDRPGWIPLDSLDTDNVDLSIYTTPVTYPTTPLPKQSNDSLSLTEETPATTKEALTLYVSPSLNARTKGKLAQGEPVTVIRIDYLGETAWAYVRSDTQDSPGWTLADALDLGNGVSIPSADDMELLEAIAEKQTAAREEHIQSDAFRRQVAQVMGGTATYTYDTAKNVYSEPSLNSSVMAEVEAGTVLHQSEAQFNDEGAWAYITADTLPEGGWILAALAEDETSSANMPQAMVEGTPAVVSVPLNVRSAPSVSSSAIAMLETGTQVRILYSENMNGTIWTRISCDEPRAIGWVMSEYLTTEDAVSQDSPLSLTAALAYFQRYIQAIALDTPDKAEGFLYFATEYSREFFRDNYAPVTGWDITAISQLSDDLCCIAWSSPGSTDYAFVGQMEGRLYVFRTVHELPEQWKAGLDVAQYEQENAMYMTEALLECYAVTKRLMDFAQPVQVKITQKDGWKPAETPWELDFADAVCGTDTWHFTQKISDKTPQCTILLTAEDGSTARIWDVDGTVLITHPDGTQEICIADFQGEATYEGSSLISTVYQWATNLA